MTYVFDATPLVYLAKVERLGPIDALAADCLIPGMVYEEVVAEGLERGYPDARRVERAVEESHFDVREAERTDLFVRLTDNPNLSRADATVLALAEQVSGTAVMDERYGRTVADTEGVPTRGTAHLVVSLVRAGELAPDEARATVDAMLDAGWYCSPDLYARINRKIDALSDER